MFLDKDYSLLYESSCQCMINSIINALGEAVGTTKGDKIPVKVEISQGEITGVIAVDKKLTMEVKFSSDETKNIVVSRKQNDAFFNSITVEQWLRLISQVQKSLKRHD